MKTYSLYLNGRFVSTSTAIEIRNPATGQVFARMHLGDRATVRQAIENADAAFSSWRIVPAKTRAEWLGKIADSLERRREEVARAITTENGKPLVESRAEVAMSIDHLRWFSEEAKRTYGRIVPHWVEGKRHLVIKSPVGVVGAISPWNFPLMLAVRKVAPAIAAGCTVVLKPARQTPISCALFAECVHETELPAGVFQLVLAPAADVGTEFLENKRCRKVSFTGSTEVGQELIRQAAAQVKPLSLELGGHGPCLVFDDVELEKAVEGVLRAKFRNTGQSCIAANRIYVQRGIYAKFLERFVVRVKELKVGDGLEPEVVIGPLIDEKALTKAVSHVKDAVQRGARLLCGGERIQRAGFFFAPTVLADVADDALCSCEETFAPIAPIYRFDSEEEALQRANNSNFGLSAYAFTNDLNRAFRVMEGLQAGTIGINDGIPTATQAPFGGMKMSGWGRELGSEGLEAFLETKHVSLGIS
jgi:succinate-semialdehyde dehydrogenase/glutarate-semialdehyde dehydrogenase